MKSAVYLVASVATMLVLAMSVTASGNAQASSEEGLVTDPQEDFALTESDKIETAEPDRTVSSTDTGEYSIRNYYQTRYDGQIPFRWGVHRASGSGFGYRHVKAQRGWGYGVRSAMFNTLRFSRLEEKTGTRRKVAWTGPAGCVWRAIYDVRIPQGYRDKFGVVTLYDDINNSNCPNYRGWNRLSSIPCPNPIFLRTY